MTALKSAWAEADLGRDRAILVARLRGRPVAAAVLDAAEKGIHLVGLLDSVHLIALRPEARAFFPELLVAAQRYFAGRGHAKFILFEETGDHDYTRPFDAKDLGEADQIFFSAALTPEFLDYVAFITAPRVGDVMR